MKEKYILIPADEKIPCRYVEIDSDNFVDDVYRHINCKCFGTAYLTPDLLFIVDDVGAFGKPINLRASQFYNSPYPLYGDAILGYEGFRDGEPDIVPLPCFHRIFFENVLEVSKES